MIFKRKTSTPTVETKFRSDKEGNDLTKYLDPSIVSKVSSLDLRARFIVEGFMLGLHKSPYHGFSVEFSQHRPYMQGDAPKDIDWKVYAKTDKFFVKQYEEETNLRCHIIMDISKSMSFASEGNISKLDYASMLTASLSFLMLKQKDAAGLVLYSDKVHKLLPPKASNIYLTEILKNLNSIVPEGETRTAECLSSVAELIQKKGLIIIISDLLDDVGRVINSLKHFRFRKNEVVVFQILDPMERNFAFGKDAIFIDVETNEEMTTQPHLLQKSYQDAFKHYLKSIKDECLNYGIDYNLLDTSVPFDKALYSYLQKRIRLH